MNEEGSFHRQGNDDPMHEPGSEFEDPFLGPDAAVTGSLEDTQAALQSEQDERDAIVEDERIPRPWEDKGDPRTSLSIAASMCDEIAEYAEGIQSLYDAGLDPDTLAESVTFNMLTGGLVIGALQLTGLLVPSIRSHIDSMLDEINASLKHATPEQIESIEAASTAAIQNKIDQLREAAREQGVTVVVEGEEDAQVADEAPTFDPRNN